MRPRSALVALAGLSVALAPAPGRASARFAVVVGENQGAPGQPRLWFAERDAERFARVLTELGDFDASDVVLLLGGSLGQVRAALAEVEGRIAAQRERGEHPLLLFYFSGHAAAQGLEMGAERLAFAELRSLVTSSSAEARVAIVDACEAGLLTQVKGASADPGLDFALPSDEQVEGTAFVASTAVGEAAQESALLGGSFFTHNLEIGLRGAADADGDGLVTLGEAFRYTAARTLSGTLATEAGGQHATYDFRMAGRGDVVLSDLRRADARLVLPRDPEASYVVHGPGGLLAEVAGGAKPVALALPAGHYRVERRAAAGFAVAEVLLERGAAQPLPPLSPTRYELARSKGGPKPGLVFAGGGLLTLGLPGFGAAPAARIGVRKELGPVGLRLRLDYAGKTASDPHLGRYDLAYVGGALAALSPLNAARVLVEAGPELGYGFATQRLASNGRGFGSSVLWAGGAAMVTAPFGPVRLGADAGVGLQAFRLDGHGVVRPAASLSLLALWGF
ncbi:MAG TPA: hypothetical protein VMU15_08285 [Anaeromyxobacter sp.]|nr:hypothetical protein [Anaeromyxobacter sp.]